MNAKKTWILVAGVALLVLLILAAIVAGIMGETLVAAILWVALPGLLGLAVGVYYLFLKMVENNLIWTRVDQGWRKIVKKWGEYYREIGPGLCLIGLPGMHTLHSEKMVFYKAVVGVDGKWVAEPRKDDKEISSFRTTRYPYAIPFVDLEDRRGLHMKGIAKVDGRITDYRKAFFDFHDWYAEMNSRVTTVLEEEVVKRISYMEEFAERLKANLDAGMEPKEAKAKAKEAVDKSVSKMLHDELHKKLGGGKSVVETLLDEVGFEVYSIHVPAFDPPEGWRDTTLAPYKAQKEKEAAVEQAKASAALLDDTNQALTAWVKDHPNATAVQIEAKQRELRDRALARIPGYQQVDIRGLENATTAVVGGGGAGGTGILVGNAGGSGGGKKSEKGGKNKPKPTPELEEDEDDDDDKYPLLDERDEE